MLVNCTSTIMMDCNPDKKIKLGKIAKLEKKLSAYETMLKIEQDRLNREANGAEFVEKYLQNMHNSADPVAAPKPPLQSEILSDNDGM